QVGARAVRELVAAELADEAADPSALGSVRLRMKPVRELCLALHRAVEADHEVRHCDVVVLALGGLEQDLHDQARRTCQRRVRGDRQQSAPREQAPVPTPALTEGKQPAIVAAPQLAFESGVTPLE